MKTPYDIYKNTKEWKTIKRAIVDLVKNNDIKLLTHHDYVIGFICQELKNKAKNENEGKVE